MKNFWKYFLIFVGVFAVAFVGVLVLFGLRFGLMQRGFGGPGIFRQGFTPMMPMMGRGGFGIFGVFGLLLGCLVPLGLLALLVAGVVALTRRKPSNLVTSTQSAGPVTSTEPFEPPAASPAVETIQTPQPETHPCPHCGQPVQNNWVACPYCGGSLAESA
jgi:hypothetical protein